MTDRDIYMNAPEGGTPEALAAYLDVACGGDAELRSRVEALLAAAREAGADFLATQQDHEDGGRAPSGSELEREGSVIGNYKLLQAIGEGGFGVVYMADQQKPVKRRVAFKLIKPGMDSKQVVARFEAERQALALMDHPNIAKVHDAGETAGGRPYFVMELVKGVPITEFCDEGNLSTEERLELFIDVCRAVQHAHQKGVIHRDLKPSNVMVTLHDDKAVVKVIDFGVAKATQTELTDKTLFTMFDQFIGTPAYMSPEQAQMSGLDIDTRSDIYALGVLLYELLTGRTPFDQKRLVSAGYDEMRRVIREDEPPKPSTRMSTLADAELTDLAKRRKSEPKKLRSLMRGDLDWIVMKALEKDRTRRYDTANGLAMDVRRHLQNEAIIARPPSVALKIQKAWKRNRIAFTAAAIVAATLAAGVVVSTRSLLREREARHEADSMHTEAIKQSEAAEQSARRVAEHERQSAVDLRGRLARGYLRQGQVLAGEGRIDKGLHMFARALQQCPPSQAALKETISENLMAWSHNCNRLVQVLDHENEASLPYRIHNRPLAMAFSPDGTRLATGGYYDHTVRIWSIAVGQPEGRPMAHEAPIRHIFFSADGEKIITADHEGTVHLWQLSGKPIVSLHGASELAFHPGTSLLAVASGTRVRTWTSEGEEIGAAFEHASAVTTLAISSDGERILVGCEDGTAHFWSVAEHRPLRPPLRDLGGPVRLFSSDGTLMIVDLSDDSREPGTAGVGQIWNAVSEQAVGSPFPCVFDKILRKPAFSQDGSLVASAAGTVVQVRSTKDGLQVGPPMRHSTPSGPLAFSPDGRLLLIATNDFKARLWSVTTGQPVGLEFARQGRVSSLAFNEDGSRIAIGSMGKAEIWSADIVSQPTRSYHAGGHPWGIDIHPDGDLVAMGTAGGTIRIWSQKSGKLIFDEPNHEMVWTALFSPDGRYLITSSRRDGSAAILRTADGKEELCELRTPRDVRCVAFNKEVSHVATGAFDGKVRIYTLPDGHLVQSLEHPGIVEDMVFSPEEDLLITGCLDGRVRFWGMDNYEERYPPLLHKDAVLAVDLNPDGTILATGGRDRTARLWDMKNRLPFGAILEHANWVEDLDFSPDGKLLLTGGADRNTQLWSVASCERVGPPYVHDQAVRTVLFDRDGGEFLSAAHPPGPGFWSVPEPVALPDDQLDLWVEARTGRRMDEHGVLALLSPKEWQEVREKLKLDGDQHLE